VARLGPGVVKGLCSILHRLVGGGVDAEPHLPLLRHRRIKVDFFFMTRKPRVEWYNSL